MRDTSSPGPEIVVEWRGSGPPVLLVHGMAGPRVTWSGLEALESSWALGYVSRRGYRPSPQLHGGQDFALDGRDLRPLLVKRPHLVAHSFGAVGALAVALEHPELIRSFTAIEPPLYGLAREDPGVAALEGIARALLTDGLDVPTADILEFLAVTGGVEPNARELPEAAARTISRAVGSRHPGDAQLDFDTFCAARVPALVVSGGDSPAFERICDVLAASLGGDRLRLPGAGHMAAGDPRFSAELDAFLRAHDAES